MADPQPFTAEQQYYLQGFALGADVARKVQGLPVIAGAAAAGTPSAAGTTLTLGTTANVGTASGPDRSYLDAQDRQVAAGGKLCPEEQAKREKNPLDRWDEVCSRALSSTVGSEAWNSRDLKSRPH